MKRLITILFIISSSLSLAQDMNDKILGLISTNLKINKDSIRLDLVISKPIPFMENTVMYVVPTIIENGDGYQIFNNNIIFIAGFKL